MFLLSVRFASVHLVHTYVGFGAAGIEWKLYKIDRYVFFLPFSRLVSLYFVGHPSHRYKPLIRRQLIQQLNSVYEMFKKEQQLLALWLTFPHLQSMAGGKSIAIGSKATNERRDRALRSNAIGWTPLSERVPYGKKAKRSGCQLHVVRKPIE